MIDQSNLGLSTINIKVEPDQSATPEMIGRAIDKFLGPRPWWYVKKEPFKWSHTSNSSSSGHEFVLGRYNKEWDPILKYIATTQYPLSCDQSLLRLEVTGGFDSFGNNFGNYISAKGQVPWG
eukprot:gene11917-24963_t